MIRIVFAGLVAWVADRLLDGADLLLSTVREDDEPTDSPCEVSYDWEGDVENVEVLTEDPRDRLAVLLFVGQGRRISRGTESTPHG